MARRKKLDNYPDRYWDLIDKAYKEPVFLPCEDIYRARSIRNDLYNFRKVLEEAAEESDKYSIISEKANSLQFSVVPPDQDHSGPRLVISRAIPLNEIPPEKIYES